MPMSWLAEAADYPLKLVFSLARMLQHKWQMALQPWLAQSSVLDSPLVVAVVDSLAGHESRVPPGTLFALIAALTALFLYGGIYVAKTRMWIWASIYFCAARDRGIKAQPSTWDDDFSGRDTRVKKVVFIRHGDSQWSSIFDRPYNLSFLGRLVLELLREAMLWVQWDSVFLDTPLSNRGIDQAWALLKLIAESDGDDHLDADDANRRKVKELNRNQLISIIRGDVGKSVVVSSTLRRAVSTAVMCLITRLSRGNDKVKVMTMLQDCGRSMDTVSITLANQLPRPPLSEASRRDSGDVVALAYKRYLCGSENTGNKGLTYEAPQRQHDFCEWVFKQTEDTIIVIGHGLWFRQFFEAHLPAGCTHNAGRRRLRHCAVVAFDLYDVKRASEVSHYRVHADSIMQVFNNAFENS